MGFKCGLVRLQMQENQAFHSTFRISRGRQNFLFYSRTKQGNCSRQDDALLK